MITQNIESVKILFEEESEGITQKSLQRFHKHRNRIGGIELVVLRYVVEPHWDYWTYLVDEAGRALVFSGFSWGYQGEGPHGLETVLKTIGFPHRINHIARFHGPGEWTKNPYVLTLYRDGSAEGNFVCQHRLKRVEELDYPFDDDTFQGEGVWQGYQCRRCGYIYHDPLD